MKWTLAIICSLGMLTATGCGQSEPVQTADWYKANDAARKAMLEKCNNNPGELGGSPNCVNAAAAAHQLFFRVPGPSDRSLNKGY